MKACPKCKSASRHRMRKKGVARLIPSGRTYACDKCNIEYTWIPVLNRTI